MKRKETFGTSGVRIKVRFFGGWDFTPGVLQGKDWVKAGYANGAPMGGDLPTPRSRAPSFMVWAVKDPDDANLDRIQIVKGWTRNGQIFEKIYDVAWSPRKGAKSPISDNLVREGKEHLPAVGNTVDIKAATYTNAIGAVELKTVWTDPDFDPSQHAFYYARVLQIPTPRWTTYDAKKLGVLPPSNVPSTVQDRAWTSPIWYSPSDEARKSARPALAARHLRQRVGQRWMTRNSSNLSSAGLHRPQHRHGTAHRDSVRRGWPSPHPQHRRQAAASRRRGRCPS